jgi:chemotaxis protein MotB
MAKAAEPVRPVIVKKVYEAAHGGHHGGAWKVAYADFVTAMMAFFLLMWLLGATTEKQRKALADYFAPTLVAQKQDSAGGSGFFGGDSIVSVDKYPNRAGQTGTRSMTIPRDATGGPKEASGVGKDRVKFEQLKQSLAAKLSQNKDCALIWWMRRISACSCQVQTS